MEQYSKFVFYNLTITNLRGRVEYLRHGMQAIDSKAKQREANKEIPYFTSDMTSQRAKMENENKKLEHDLKILEKIYGDLTLKLFSGIEKEHGVKFKSNVGR